jgi:hypothetical protein
MPDVWHFFHVKNCPQTKPPKDKFVLIVCRDSGCRGFFVNSNINQFIQKRPSLLACQVVLKASDYGFLPRDSYLDCGQLFPFDDILLVDGRGSATTQTISEIKQVVANAKTIEKRHKQLICGS